MEKRWQIMSDDKNKNSLNVQINVKRNGELVDIFFFFNYEPHAGEQWNRRETALVC